MSNESDIHELEMSINTARAAVEKMEALNRLSQTSDFLTVIGKGYFEQEAHSLVRSKAHPALQGEDEQQAIVKKIDSIGQLYAYFSVIQQQGTAARDAIIESEETIDEILEEAS